LNAERQRESHPDVFESGFAKVQWIGKKLSINFTSGGGDLGLSAYVLKERLKAFLGRRRPEHAIAHGMPSRDRISLSGLPV